MHFLWRLPLSPARMPASEHNSVRVLLAASIAVGIFCPYRDVETVAALLAYSMLDLKQPSRKRKHGAFRARWDLDSIDAGFFEVTFRFKSAEDVRELMDELDFPERWETSRGCIFTGEEAISVYLARLAWPNRYITMSAGDFPANTGALSDIFNQVEQWMMDNHTSRMLQTGMTKWLPRCETYSDAITAKHGFEDFPGCIGFIDGTFRPTGKPGGDFDMIQRLSFSGHKRGHGMQFLSITAPDGIILWTYGPSIGKDQDNTMVKESKFFDMMKTLHRLAGTPSEQPYFVYGDAVFKWSRYLQKAFERHTRNPRERRFNKRMNSVRVSVEHVFGRVVNNWKAFFMKPQQKLLLTKPGRSYLNAQFLTNCHTCMYGNQVSRQFDLDPPSLHEYLHNFREVEVEQL